MRAGEALVPGGGSVMLWVLSAHNDLRGAASMLSGGQGITVYQ